jgi:hypothetical protein
MKPSKVMQELKKRGIDNPKNASREALEQLLHDAVAKEPCCLAGDCFCNRNGMECQADACSCWHDSHVHTKITTASASSGGYIPVQEIQNRCGNPLGMDAVDMEAIGSYRNTILETVICQPVTGGGPL